MGMTEDLEIIIELKKIGALLVNILKELKAIAEYQEDIKNNVTYIFANLPD